MQNLNLFIAKRKTCPKALGGGLSSLLRRGSLGISLRKAIIKKAASARWMIADGRREKGGAEASPSLSPSRDAPCAFVFPLQASLRQRDLCEGERDSLSQLILSCLK